MAIEQLQAEQWIYSKLSGDSTLAGLLAPDSGPSGFQSGIYSYVAPDIDFISGARPEPPFIVFRLDSGSDNERALDGSRAQTTLTYRITVWDSSSGSATGLQGASIMARVDELLDNISDGAIWCRRELVAQRFTVRGGGATDTGVSATYTITIGA